LVGDNQQARRVGHGEPETGAVIIQDGKGDVPASTLVARPVEVSENRVDIAVDVSQFLCGGTGVGQENESILNQIFRLAYIVAGNLHAPRKYFCVPLPQELGYAAASSPPGNRFLHIFLIE
jgi:hypothetical protein